ncbi:hypothetical protein JCM19233_4787 [Vibrio astriarenae]|nr:hypothetical protein JCM19233_4787 [Vibrio sp. C7]
MNHYEKLYDKVEVLTQELKSFLCRAESASFYTYKPEPRRQTIESINTTHSTSITDAIDSFSFQFKRDGITVPRKSVGLIYILSKDYLPLLEITDELNKVKMQFKSGLPAAIPSRYERRKFIDNLCEGVITSTIYRKILVAPRGTYRSSLSWSVNQKAPNPVSESEALTLINSQIKPFDGELELDFAMRLERTKNKVSSCANHLVRLQNVRVHPGQTLKVKKGEQARGVPYYYNPSTPIICVDDSGHCGFKESGLEKYDIEKHIVKHRPTNYSSILQPLVSSLGIYSTEKPRDKKVLA